MKPLVITGCQRSGTAYTAALLTACGWWCSHERFFNEQRVWPLQPSTIDSSWAAAPHLPDLGAHIIHQVRHPLAVIASCLARGTFAGKMRPSARWARSQHPSIMRNTDNHLLRTMRYWVEWNLLIEPHADLRWPVENLTPQLLADTLTGWERSTSLARATAAAELIPQDVNHVHTVEPLNWTDLPDKPLTRRLREMAERYGYR